MAGRRVKVGGLAAVAAGVGAGWAGLRMQPTPFDPAASVHTALGTVELPPDLPAPVHRFFIAVGGGETLPRVERAVISGRGRMRPFGFWLPMRYRFTHTPGESYRHQIEATWYGRPVFSADEVYEHGQAVLNLPFGAVSGEPKVNEAASIALWAEGAFFPALWLDERVRWEPVGDAAARMIVADRGHQHTFDFTFDPDTGLLSELYTLRYRDASDAARTGWSVTTTDWRRFGPVMLPATTRARWHDRRGPWSEWRTEYVAYND